jgi:hypothetical protein
MRRRAGPRAARRRRSRAGFFIERRLVHAAPGAGGVESDRGWRTMVAAASFNAEHKAVLDDLLLGDSRVRPGTMFGLPAYYAGRKLAICLYEQGVGVKLPEATAATLLETDSNVTPFQPMGRRRMREWVQIDLGRSQDYRQYAAVFDESLRHVLAQQET